MAIKFFPGEERDAEEVAEYIKKTGISATDTPDVYLQSVPIDDVCGDRHRYLHPGVCFDECAGDGE